jgi:hypothetical protein
MPTLVKKTKQFFCRHEMTPEQHKKLQTLQKLIVARHNFNKVSQTSALNFAIDCALKTFDTN